MRRGAAVMRAFDAMRAWPLQSDRRPRREPHEGWDGGVLLGYAGGLLLWLLLATLIAQAMAEIAAAH
jgi:hypothetical protein